MKDIKLYNRDGADLKLVSEDGKLWEFQVDKNHEYVLKYCRLGFKEDNKTIDFIDPAGGPFLRVGEKIENYYAAIDSIIEVDNKIKIHINPIIINE